MHLIFYCFRIVMFHVQLCFRLSLKAELLGLECYLIYSNYTQVANTVLGLSQIKLSPLDYAGLCL